MKRLRLLLVGLLITFSSVFVLADSNAGQVSTSNASLSWDDSSFYEPSSGCSKFTFNLVTNDRVYLSTITITNKFNDILGNSSAFGQQSGKVEVQVCSGKDVTGAKVSLRLQGTSRSGVDDAVSAPIQFLSRGVASTPKPAAVPTVTVTAAPVPAQTVYVTNPADQTLSDLVASLKSQVNMLNAKLKKVCSVKPKPKGC